MTPPTSPTTRWCEEGLTWPGVVWAFANLHGEATYWHPVTWLSHMLDCQLFGLKPAGHHLTSLFLHTFNTVLLFAVLRRMTGRRGPSAMVAALFALHPLQVDSVAWIAERKNVLSTFFFLLTLWAYVRYAEVQSRKSEAGGPSTLRSPATEDGWSVVGPPSAVPLRRTGGHVVLSGICYPSPSSPSV